MSNILSVNETEVAEQIYQAHRVYQDFEEDKHREFNMKGEVETLPVHDESQEEIEGTFNKYAAVCERDMEAIIGMVNAFKGCDMNMSNVVASSPLRRQNIMEKRIYRNRARTNKGQRGGLR